MRIILLAIITLIASNPCFSQPDPEGSHIVSWEADVKADVRTTITLIGEDSTRYILFDNLLSRNQTIVFTHQPHYYDTRSNGAQEGTISLPFPILKQGKYTLRYMSADTSYTSTFFYLH